MHQRIIDAVTERLVGNRLDSDHDPLLPALSVQQEVAVSNGTVMFTVGAVFGL